MPQGVKIDPLRSVPVTVSSLALGRDFLAEIATDQVEEQRERGATVYGTSPRLPVFHEDYERVFAGVSEPGTNLKLAASWQFAQ